MAVLNFVVSFLPRKVYIVANAVGGVNSEIHEIDGEFKTHDKTMVDKASSTENNRKVTRE